MSKGSMTFLDQKDVRKYEIYEGFKANSVVSPDGDVFVYDNWKELVDSGDVDMI